MTLPYDFTTACDVLCENDPALSILIERVGPFNLELRHEYSPFQAILRSIVYQQLSGKAAATIYGRVCALFPDMDHPTPAAIEENQGFCRDCLEPAGGSAPDIAGRDIANPYAMIMSGQMLLAWLGRRRTGLLELPEPGLGGRTSGRRGRSPSPRSCPLGSGAVPTPSAPR